MLIPTSRSTSVSAYASDADKRAWAIEVLADRDNLTISGEVLAEFYYEATRMSRASRLTHAFMETLR